MGLPEQSNVESSREGVWMEAPAGISSPGSFREREGNKSGSDLPAGSQGGPECGEFSVEQPLLKDLLLSEELYSFFKASGFEVSSRICFVSKHQVWGKQKRLYSKR